MKQTVQVTILGQQYTVRSEADPEEVRRVASFVNEKIAEVAGGNRAVDTLNTTVLALLNVAGSYLRLRDEGGGSSEEAERRIQAVLERLDNTLS